MRLDWGSPKISLGEFHSYLQTMLGDKFNGLMESEGYLYIETSAPITGDEEASILDYYYILSNKSVNTAVTSQPDPAPFAVPTYRTKRNSTIELTVVPVGQSVDIDYYVTAERYAAGGTLLVENAVFGDYCIACVYDKDGVIPAPYRALMCENHPIVATYIEKEWVEVTINGISKHKIDTYPLNAKVTAGLYLRITYYAVNSGNDRRVAVNYYLTKKL